MNKRVKQAALSLYLINTIVVAMLVGQEESLVLYSPLYFQMVLPTLLVPLLWVREIFQQIRKGGFLLLCFLVIAGGWQIADGQIRVLPQLILLIWALLWISALDIQFKTGHYLWLFLVAIVLGIAFSITLQNNPWGILPETTSAKYTVWRVSFFPSVVQTGLLALFAAIALAENRWRFLARLGTNIIIFYFLIFSFVRTVFISALIFAPLSYLFYVFRQSTRVLFGGALLICVTVPVAVLIAPYILFYAQDIDLISRLLLRNANDLSLEDITQQLMRAWIWQQHWEIFTQSDYLMGAGNFTFYVPSDPDTAPTNGSESLLTRLLATYGLPTLFLGLYFISVLWENAKRADYLGCAAFPIVITISLNYGSVLHPSSLLFFLYFNLMIHGRRIFADHEQSNT